MHSLEPEELRDLFIAHNSMNRGALAGAQWIWEGNQLTVKLVANGKATLQEAVPLVVNQLRQRFGTDVTVAIEAGQALEGKALEEAMEKMRMETLKNLPRAGSAAEKKPAAPAETDAKRQYEEQKKARSEARGLIKRREQMQKRADALEAELSQIEAEMQKPEVATDYVKTAALYERLEAAEAELLELYEALME